MMNFRSIFPILQWLPKYGKETFLNDFSAGITVGVMLIPQGMAYALIAGLPPQYGLYAAIVPQLIYAILGTSRQLAVGPVAMDSLLVAAGLSSMAAVGSNSYIMLALLLAFMMGVIQLIGGVVRLGFMVNFLSKPVISGFTSGAAIVIGMNQLKYLVELDLPRSNSPIPLITMLFEKLQDLNWTSLILGVVGIIVIVVLKSINKRIPAALIIVILSTGLVWLGALSQYPINLVGEIPKGLPQFSLHAMNFTVIKELFPVALTLALIAFMEAISVSKELESTHRGEYKIKPNQEMIALGASNIVGSFFGAYPTTGGFSRSAVNNQAGAKTNMAAIISALLVGLVLVFFTHWFYYLPKTILASIVLVAVFGLINFKYAVHLWKLNRVDFYMLLVTFLVTLFVGIMYGIAAGVAFSFIFIVYKTTLPHVAILGRLPGTTDYRNVNRFKEIEQREDILVIRYDARLFFANSSHFEESIKEAVHQKKNVKLVVLHCGSISSIDSTALEVLKEVVIYLSERDIEICFSGLIGPVRDVLYFNGFVNDVGDDKFFLEVQLAIDYYDHKLKGKKSDVQFKLALQTNLFGERPV